jgi:hypothetical protein
VEFQEEYLVKISNAFVALENLNDDDDDDDGGGGGGGGDVDISRAWESIRENMKASATDSLGFYELKEHKPWFDEGHSKLLDQRKQTELQGLQNQDK